MGAPLIAPIAAQARNPGGGLIVMPDSFNVVNREPIIALAARYGVPAIYWNRFFTESGGLITYGTDFVEQFRQVPEYIDRILKGAKPADASLCWYGAFVLSLRRT